MKNLYEGAKATVNTAVEGGKKVVESGKKAVDKVRGGRAGYEQPGAPESDADSPNEVVDKPSAAEKVHFARANGNVFRNYGTFSLPQIVPKPVNTVPEPGAQAQTVKVK